MTHDYENEQTYTLRARFAVRALGWTWWRSKRDGLAVLIPPLPRTRFNFAESLFDPVELDVGATPPRAIYSDAFAQLYDNHQYKRDNNDYDNSPTFFDPSLASSGSCRHTMYVGANLWRIASTMRARGFPAQVYTETHTEPPRTQVSYEVSQQPYDYKSCRNVDPERAALISALRCLDAAADVAQTPPDAPERKGE